MQKAHTWGRGGMKACDPSCCRWTGISRSGGARGRSHDPSPGLYARRRHALFDLLGGARQGRPAGEGLASGGVGDPRTQAGHALLRERSPLHAAAIAKPLPIGQGANDRRVKEAQSAQIIAAMRAKALPVTYALYPEEGHGFAVPQNRISFFAIAEAFLAAHLGGRAEPIGGDFAGAKFEVSEGASRVPGLEVALAARGSCPIVRPPPRCHQGVATWMGMFC